MLLTPAERDETRNPAEGILSEAVSRTRLSLSGGGSGANGDFAPRADLPAYGTTAGVNGGDGTIYTIHPFIWDLDNWDDPAAVWAD